MSHTNNSIIATGIFPSKLKVAKVVSLVKKGDPEFASNYRPISLLPIFSKLFEKLMYKRLYSFVTQNHITYPLQFGFQKKLSIEHALISLTETIKYKLRVQHPIRHIEKYKASSEIDSY